MSTSIFYYTGTGNSLWIASQMAKNLGDAQSYSIVDLKDGIPENNSDIVGLIFPVYIWVCRRQF